DAGRRVRLAWRGVSRVGRRPLPAAKLGAANLGPRDLCLPGCSRSAEGAVCMISSGGAIAAPTSSEPLRPAPPVEHFPAWPASWYLFGSARELRKGPVAK